MTTDTNDAATIAELRARLVALEARTPDAIARRAAAEADAERVAWNEKRAAQEAFQKEDAALKKETERFNRWVEANPEEAARRYPQLETNRSRAIAAAKKLGHGYAVDFAGFVRNAAGVRIDRHAGQAEEAEAFASQQGKAHREWMKREGLPLKYPRPGDDE